MQGGTAYLSQSKIIQIVISFRATFRKCREPTGDKNHGKGFSIVLGQLSMRGRNRRTICRVRLFRYSYLGISAYAMQWSAIRDSSEMLPAKTSFSWKEIDVIELACLICTGKILVSNSIDLQKKRRPIFPPYGPMIMVLF